MEKQVISVNNLKEKIIISLASLIVGISISILLKTNLELYTPVTIKSIQNQKDEINMIKEEINDLKEMLVQKQETLEVVENISKGEESIIDVLKKDNEINRLRAGYINLEGPGIMIKMFDNPEDRIVGFDINDDLIHDVDILNILNDLKLAGAEAISINGERLLPNSEIKCGGPVININGENLGAPFIIKAIGDPKILKAAVNAPDTYGETLKNVYFVGFEVETHDKIIVHGYSRNFTFKHAKPKGEGDL